MVEPPNEPCIYVLDSSSWILIEGNPAHNRILDCIAQLTEAGRIKSPPEVLDELERTSPVKDWVDQHKDLIVERRSNEVDYLMKVGEVSRRFPSMQGVRRRKEKADAWVVGLAIHASNPRQWAVVSDETGKKRPSRKVPTACASFGIECYGLIEMLRREFPDDDW